MSAISITDWEKAGVVPACQSCLDYRAELELMNTRLAKANALLRFIRRAESKPARPEGLDDDPATLAAIGHVVLEATIRARIDLYLAATGQRL